MHQGFHADSERNSVPFDVRAGRPEHSDRDQELEGGIQLDDLSAGALIEVTTKHNRYLLENLGDGKVVIQGHEYYCPSPTVVRLVGSVCDGADLKERYIGRRMRMEFVHPEYHLIRTSQVQSVRVLPHS